ncbi:MAG TPA: SMP-30/gluconolactonase/LRE family protein, partial [Bryobacteraceae bacterium]|nr:SMP-30/gluconolactonase/LRE family protein [Bryobacteraceae bacterium]
IQIETVLTGFGYTAGPAWSPENFLVFSDVPGRKILKVTQTGTSILRENSGGASGNAFDKRGRLHTCEAHTRRLSRTDAKGKVEVLAENFEGKRLNAPNDLCIADTGHIFFTDPAYGNQQDKRELPFHGIFHVSPKGDLRLAARFETRPNGIALSADDKRLFVSNSDERNIRVYDVSKEGLLTGERIFATKMEGIPSGLHSDDKGNLWVAARNILLFDASGKSLGHIPLRDTPSGCTLVLGDPTTLYVTARKTVYRVRLDEKGASAN